MADVSGKSEAEMKINLSALKKHDPEIDEIIDTASGVAHYKFRSDSGVWEKTDVEGSLFLYSRKVSPYIIVFIMNRLNKENTSLPVTQHMEFKVQKPFLLCKGENSEIIGLWFYDPRECQRFGTLLSRLSVLSKDERSLKIAIMMEIQKRQAVSSEIQQVKQPKPNGLLSMFTKAQQEFEQSRGRTKNARDKNKQGKKHNDSARRKSTPSLQTDQIKGKTSPSNEKENQKAYQQRKFIKDHQKEQEILLRILHGNSDFSSGTLNGNFDPAQRVIRTRTMSSSHDLDTESSQRESIHKFSSQAGDLAIFNKLGIITENSNQNINQKKVIGCAELESELLNRNRSDNDLKLLHRSVSCDSSTIRTAKSTPNVGEYLLSSKEEKPEKVTDLLENKSVVTSSNVGITSNVSLLSPSSMKSKSSGKGRGTIMTTLMNGQQKISLAANFNQSTKSLKKLFPDDSKTENKLSEAPSSAAVNSLITPAAFQQSTSATHGTTKPNGNNIEMLLDKEQFQEALIHLIKTDDKFVTTLHDAYLEVKANR